MCCDLCRQYVGVVQQFVAFQRESVEDYIVALREHLNRRTSAQAQANITLSANNGGSWDTPFFLFDYGMGELEMHDASPSGALAIVIVHNYDVQRADPAAQSHVWSRCSFLLDSARIH